MFLDSKSICALEKILWGGVGSDSNFARNWVLEGQITVFRHSSLLQDAVL
jgi:hypothetical protein